MKTHAPTRAKTILDADGLGRTLSRIAHEIIEGNPALDEVALVGIQTRGVPLARRLARLISERAGVAPDVGTVDITFHRDDVSVRHGEAPRAAQPSCARRSSTSRSTASTVVLVDDVLYTGRTIRAAIETLFDYGRPARVQLAVLVDRGHRELPIRPDYVGKNLPDRARRADPGAARRGGRGRRRLAHLELRGRGGGLMIRLVNDHLRPPTTTEAPPSLGRRPDP